MAASTENYALGKGVVNFDQLVGGVYRGERDMGNCPEFAFNMTLEKLEHFSSRGGLRSKDKEAISQVTPTVSFTLDEITPANVALLTLADIDTVTQVVATVTDETHKAYKDTKINLSKRAVGLFSLALTGAPTAAGAVGDTLTGDTSSATGVIQEFDAVGNIYYLSGVTGTFVDAEPLTASGGSATEAGTALGTTVFVSGKVVVKKAGTPLVDGTDFQVDTNLKDDLIGRVEILEGASITEGDDVTVTYDCQGYTYKRLRAIAQTSIEGRLRFVSDNPLGRQQELEIWRVSLTPSGDTAMIGEDWSTLAFTGEILKDESKDAAVNSQYFNIYMDGVVA